MTNYELGDAECEARWRILNIVLGLIDAPSDANVVFAVSKIMRDNKVMLSALQEIDKNDPGKQSSAGIIARAAIGKVR